jgi:endonuclease/exonuclease/phosphatase family metal-dependent hydrolase
MSSLFLLVLVFAVILFSKRHIPEKRAKNSVTIISWNTNGVIQNSLDFKSRFQQGLNHPFIADADVLCLQEIFTKNKVHHVARKVLEESRNFFKHSLDDEPPITQRSIYETSGLVNCSSSPSVSKLHIFRDRTSFDIMAQKGFLHTKLENGVHVINLHIQSILREINFYDTYFFSRISVYQRKQIRQLERFLKHNFHPTNDKIVILGDFNINPYNDIVNGMFLSTVLTRLGFKQRPFDRYESKFDCEYLDHVWYKNMRIKKLHVPPSQKELLRFSDHLPVKTTFSF